MARAGVDPVAGVHAGRVGTAGRSERSLWGWWVAANTVGETVGLGATAAVAVAVAGAGETGRTGAMVAATAALVAAGAFEGLAVGVAQWSVLRSALTALRARRWIVATVVGALVAWLLGVVPATLGGGAGTAEAPPFGQAVQLVLAAVMGLVLGPVLGVPQWRVLRRHVPRASRWVLANAVAWAAGMPVVFFAAGSVPADASPRHIAFVVVAACAAAGAVVGAIHGAWLVRLVRPRLDTAPTRTGGQEPGSPPHRS